MTFFSINKESPLEPVQKWDGELNRNSAEAWYDIKNSNNAVRLYSPYNRAYCWEYYDDAETAENARRMAILARFDEIKRERARLLREANRLKEEIISWATD